MSYSSRFYSVFIASIFQLFFNSYLSIRFLYSSINSKFFYCLNFTTLILPVSFILFTWSTTCCLSCRTILLLISLICSRPFRFTRSCRNIFWLCEIIYLKALYLFFWWISRRTSAFWWSTSIYFSFSRASSSLKSLSSSCLCLSARIYAIFSCFYLIYLFVFSCSF